MNNSAKLDKALQKLYEFLESNSLEKKQELAFEFEEMVLQDEVFIPNGMNKEITLVKLQSLAEDFAYYTDDPIARAQWSDYYSGEEMEDIIVKCLRELSNSRLENIPEKYLK